MHPHPLMAILMLEGRDRRRPARWASGCFGIIVGLVIAVLLTIVVAGC